MTCSPRATARAASSSLSRGVLADDADGARLERPAHLLDVGRSGHDEHSAAGSDEGCDQVAAVADRTAEVEVEQDQRGSSFDDLADEGLTVTEVGDRALDALEPERQREGLGEQLVVVHQDGAGQGTVGPGGFREDARGHATGTSWAARAGIAWTRWAGTRTGRS